MKTPENKTSPVGLGDLNLTEILQGEAEATQPIELKGKSFELNVQLSPGETIELTAEIKDDEESLIMGSLTVDDNKGYYEAHTRVDKLSDRPELKGVPLQLDQTILRYIQTVANQLKDEVVHTPTCPDDFPIEVWERVFGPLLKAELYSQIRPGQWEKKYQAQ